MKKLKVLKKGLTLFLVLFLCIENFAAVVSDNDGSAFITKAEFDSLKNNFQSQIDQYNTSIDSKIDGAIAAYLAGIKVDNTTTENIIFYDWTDGVYHLNGTLKPEFRYPSLNMYYNIGQDHRADGRYDKMWWAWLQIKNTENTSSHNYRPLISNVVEGSSVDLSNAIWGGRATNWSEAIRATRSVEQYSRDPGVSGDGVKAGRVPTIRLRNALVQASDGYYPVENYDLWKPTVYWYNAMSESDYSSYVTNKVIQYSHELNLNLYNGAKIDYEHILSWSDSNWSVWNQSFNKTLRTSSYQTLTRAQVFNNASVSGDISGTEWFHSKPNPELLTDYTDKWFLTVWVQRSPTQAYEISTSKWKTAGLVSDSLASSRIKQSTSRIASYGSKNYDLNLNLCQGLPICVAKEGETISWKPVFSDVTCASSASSYITTNGKINILLSTEPFGARGAIDSKYIIKTLDMESGAVTTNYTTTPEGSLTTTLKFNMPKDGVVYAIWWPTCTSSTYRDNYDWQVKLDIANSNTFDRTVSR